MLLLAAVLSALQAPLGLPVRVDYRVPEGYRLEALPEGEGFSALGDSAGVVTLVPLLLDTLALPDLRAVSAGDTVLLTGPVLAVVPLLPDSALVPAGIPAPAPMNIPPGFPGDYLRRLAFWIPWGGPPGFPWLPVSAGVLVCAGAAWFFVSRRRRAAASPESGLAEAGSPDRAALALLESDAFVHGDWKALYALIDALFRALAARRFGLANPALTLYQIERAISREKGAGGFLEKASPLMREIVLQIYANRGSTRDRSRGFIEALAELFREKT
jgi:hypothetical protein